MDHVESHPRAGAGGVIQHVQDGDLEYLPDPGYRITTLAAAAAVAPEQLRRQPSRLLAEAHRFIAFRGRAPELRELHRWRDGPDRFDVLLVHGVGGQGKTRLAREFARQSATLGWAPLRAVPVRPDDDPQPSTGSLPAGHRGRLVLIDCAERWAAPTLRRALADARLHEVCTRVLVLARPAGDWWRPVRRYAREKFSVDRPALGLQPFPVDSADREWLFAAARDGFAGMLGTPGVRKLGKPPNWSGGATALEIQMAALASVYADARDDPMPADPGELSAYLLDREYDHRAELHPGDDPQTLARALWLACLAGPLRHPEASRMIIDTGLAAPGEESRRLLDAHRRSCPGDVLAPLRPGRLAEDFVAFQAVGRRDAEADAWTRGRLGGVLGALAPDQVTHLLTMAITVAQRWAPFAREHLDAVLRNEPAMVVSAGAPVLNALAGLPGLDSATLSALEAEMPLDGEPELMDPLASLSVRLYRKLRAANAPELARLEYRVARRLVCAFRFAEARGPIEDALGRLFAQGSTEHAELGRTLGCLAEVMEGLGRTTEALALSEQALSSWDYPYEVDADHARRLGFHARLLHAQRRSADAANRQREATVLWRKLAAGNAQLLVGLARSLSAQADYLRAARSRVEAATAASQAAVLWAKLDQAAPDDRYRIDLLDSWIAVAISPEVPAATRLESARRAADSLQRLWPGDVTVLPRATNAQRVLAMVLSDQGQHEQALGRIRTARKMVGWLGEQSPVRHQRLRARVLFAYVRCCMLTETDLAEAIKAAEETEMIFGSLGDKAQASAAARLRDQCTSLRTARRNTSPLS